MSAGKFVGVVVALFAGTFAGIWVVASASAVVYALSRGDGDAAGLYAVFTVVGLVVLAGGVWAARAVARSRAGRR